MSISLWFEGDDKRTTEYECQCTYGDRLPITNCEECNGTGKVTFENNEHEFNMCNSNAAEIFNLTGIPFDYAGTIEVEQQDRVIRECLKVKNRVALRKRAYREPLQVGRMFSGGIDDEYILTRIDALLDLVKAAKQKQTPVYWG